MWLVFVGQLLFAAIMLPPWQNPDEPVHFAVARTLAARPLLEFADRYDQPTQAEILQSMAEHRWWAAYGEAVPDPLPVSFGGGVRHSPQSPPGGRPIGDASYAPPLYYMGAGAVLRVLGVDGLIPQYYTLRILSLLTSLATFAFVIHGVREWFGDLVSVYAAAVVALIPQFALIAVSVSPDPLVFLAATVVWWQAGRAFAGKGLFGPLMMMALATVVALLSKQLALVLLVQFVALAALVIVNTGLRRRLVLVGGAAVGMTALAVSVVWPVSVGELTAPDLMEGYLRLLDPTGTSVPEWYFLGFTWRFFESSYLVAGWLRFHAPAFVVATALALLALAAVRGAGVGLVAGPPLRIGVLVALLFVLIQLASVFATRYYLPGYGAQGRFLFPAIAPLTALCALGLVRWHRTTTRLAVSCGALALLAVLDAASWIATVVPAYSR